MRKIIMGAAAVAATTVTPAAYALNFDFTFTGTDFNTGAAMTINGEIEGLAASGESAPAHVLINSQPFGLPVGYDIFSAHVGQADGGFTVHNGQITHAHYFVTNRTSLGTYVGISLRLSVTHWTFLDQLGGRRGDVFGGQLATTTLSGSVNAAVGIPPAYVATTMASGGSTSSAPEPASIALLGAGLSGIAAFRRRRASA